jgi:hypothetical protein
MILLPGRDMFALLLAILYLDMVMILVLVCSIMLMHLLVACHGLMLFLMMGLNRTIACFYFRHRVTRLLTPAGSNDED